MEDCAAFDGFLPFQQSAPYAEAASAMGARVGWHDLGCGRALVVERGRLRSVFRGPVWAKDALESDRRRALRRLGRWPGLTVVTPDSEVTGFGLVPLVTPLHHVIWALSDPPQLRHGLDRRWRNHLVQAERRGFRFQRDRPQTLAALLQAEAPQRLTRGYQALPQGFSLALPQGALRLWEWRAGGALGAAMCFVRHGTSASYHLSWAGTEARVLGVHQLMLWQAALALAEEGVRWLDLGSVDTEAAPGLARFKLGTGARLHRLGSTLLVLPG